MATQQAGLSLTTRICSCIIIKIVLNHLYPQEPDFQFRVVAAFDVNEVANEVYGFNCKLINAEDYTPIMKEDKSSSKSLKKQRTSLIPSAMSIEKLTVPMLDALAADIWVMSPPCQPHTRNNRTTKRDTSDPRLRHKW